MTNTSNTHLFVRQNAKGDHFLWCELCQGAKVLNLPLPLADYSGELGAFTERHQSCDPAAQVVGHSQIEEMEATAI